MHLRSKSSFLNKLHRRICFTFPNPFDTVPCVSDGTVQKNEVKHVHNFCKKLFTVEQKLLWFQCFIKECFCNALSQECSGTCNLDSIWHSVFLDNFIHLPPILLGNSNSNNRLLQPTYFGPGHRNRDMSLMTPKWNVVHSNQMLKESVHSWLSMVWYSCEGFVYKINAHLRVLWCS